MKIAFLGLGNMGQPMARNLLRAGHELTVWNRTASRAETLAAEGALAAETPEQAARECEVMITMLADDAAVAACMESARAGLRAGATHIGMSTVSPEFSNWLAVSHAVSGQIYVAAPVFGRPEAAAAAKLWIVAAGPLEHVEKYRSLFEAMGRAVTVVGEQAERANVVKLAGNFLIAAMIEALGEAFALARKCGVDAKQFLETANGALFNSPIYANYGGIIAERKYEPAGFKLRLGMKDIHLALDAARAAGVPMPLAGLVGDHLLAAMAHGKGEMDWAALAQVAAENAGLDLT